MNPSELLPTLRDLPPRQFEQLVADVWEEGKGWSTEVMPPGPDRGVDVLATPPKGCEKTAFQIKRYGEGNKVSSREVQQYASLTQMEDEIENVTIVTTSSFTSNAKEMAADLGINHINGTDLVNEIEHYGTQPIVEWYADGKPSVDDPDARFNDVDNVRDSVGNISIIDRVQIIIGKSDVDIVPLIVALSIAAYLVIAQPLSGSFSGINMNWIAITVILIGGLSASFDKQ